MKTKRGFLIAGIIFLIWWIFDLILKSRYHGEYIFLWFCSIALLLLTIGFFTKKSVFFISFLSIALIGQGGWMIDFFSIALFSTPLTGQASYFFENGFPFADFIDALRHFIMIPIALIALKNIKKTNKYAWIYSMILVAMMGVSGWFLSTPSNDVNCAFRACLSLNIEPNLLFSLAVLACWIMIVSFISYIIHKLLEKAFIYKSKKHKKILNYIILIFIIIGIIGIILASLAYLKIPHYICKSESQNIVCEGTFPYTDLNNTEFYVDYHVKNKQNKTCIVTAYTSEEILNKEEIYVAEKISKNYIVVPIPLEEGDIYLKLDCTK